MDLRSDVQLTAEEFIQKVIMILAVKLNNEILAIELTNVLRGEAYDSLMKLSDEIQEELNLLKLGISNGTNLVKEHCMDLRSYIQLTADLKVNDITTKIIEEIDEYENELIEFNKTNSE
jgi:hypothetical protein